MMKKIYIVPNAVTSANLFSGFFSIIASFQGNFEIAAWAILVGAVFDLLDGRIARLARATSEFGVQYDSMADLVTFGLAPGLLLYSWGLHGFGQLGWIAAFLFVICAALRLARFNVMASRLPKGYFQGLPSPAAACIVATFLIFSHAVDLTGVRFAEYSTIILSVGLGLLMVSNVPFPSFKELNWRSKASFGYLLVFVLVMLFIAMRPTVTLFLFLIFYLVASLIWAAYSSITGRQSLRKNEDQVELQEEENSPLELDAKSQTEKTSPESH
jgi:CDP-diacylglycerol---serine O-phosphatidyltransferase